MFIWNIHHLFVAQKNIGMKNNKAIQINLAAPSFSQNYILKKVERKLFFLCCGEKRLRGNERLKEGSIVSRRNYYDWATETWSWVKVTEEGSFTFITGRGVFVVLSLFSVSQLTNSILNFSTFNAETTPTDHLTWHIVSPRYNSSANPPDKGLWPLSEKHFFVSLWLTLNKERAVQ